MAFQAYCGVLPLILTVVRSVDVTSQALSAIDRDAACYDNTCNGMPGLELMQRSGSYAVRGRLRQEAAAHAVDQLAANTLEKGQGSFDVTDPVSVERFAADFVRFNRATVPSIVEVFAHLKEALIGGHGLQNLQDFANYKDDYFKVAYEEIQSLKTIPEMATFLKLLVQSAGGSLPPEDETLQLAHECSDLGNHTLWSDLFIKLHEKGWLPEGSTAAFTEMGFRAVAGLPDDLQKVSFLRRLAESNGASVTETTISNYVKTNLSGNGARIPLLRELKNDLLPTSMASQLIGQRGPCPFETWCPEAKEILAVPVVMNLMGFVMGSGLKRMASSTLASMSTLQSRLVSISTPADFQPFTNDVSEMAFLAVQALHDLPAMESYIKMLLQSAGASPLPELREISLVAAKYAAPQSWESWLGLWSQLARLGWLPTGQKAAFTESGYMAVASTGSLEQMTVYVGRLLNAMGGRADTNTSLTNFAAYFNGTSELKTLKRLTKELREQRGWVKFVGTVPEQAVRGLHGLLTEPSILAEHATSEMVMHMQHVLPQLVRVIERFRWSFTDGSIPAGLSGFTPTMGENGFKALQATRNSRSMAQYVDMLIRATGAAPQPFDVLSGFAPHYSGEVSSQPWLRLWDELVERGWVPDGSNAALTEMGLLATATRRNPFEVAKFVRRQVEQDGGCITNQDGLVGFCHHYAGWNLTERSLGKLRSELANKAATEGWLEFASDAAINQDLSQESYVKIQNRRSDCFMGLFLNNMLVAMGGNPLLGGDLSGAVPYFSGTKGAAPWDAMLEQMEEKGWLPRGDKAAFNELGYTCVRIVEDPRDMVRYIHRMVEADGGQVLSEDRLKKFAAYYTYKVKEYRPYNELVQDLKSKESEGWLKYPGNGPSARFLMAKGAAPGHYPEFVERLASEMVVLVKESAKSAVHVFRRLQQGLSSTVAPAGTHEFLPSISEMGFRSVQALRCDDCMAQYLKMLLHAAGGGVRDENELLGITHFYSGTQASQLWSRCWEELADKGWAPDGVNAAITESGYMGVGVRKNPYEMQQFVQRVIAADGGTLTKTAELQGFVQLYDGTQRLSSLQALRADLRKKASEEMWLTYGHFS